MEEKQTLSEKEDALRRAQDNREHVLRRKRIDLYKNIIIVMVCAVSMAPVCFSMFLLYQVSTIEQKVSYLAGQKDAQDSVSVADSKETITSDVQPEGERTVTSQEVEAGKRVYLTFDDGPSDNTDEILDILERNEVKATFFVTAQDNHLEEYKKIVDAGHAIGIHSYTHNYSKVYASKKSFIKDVTDMSDLIYRETGVRTRLYRFPGGSANSVSSTPVETLIEWLNEEDYIYFDWNALTGDAVTKDLSASTLIDNVMANIKQNTKNNIDSTVLMHDLTTKHNTVEALEPLIQTLKEQGYVMDKALDESVKPVQQKVIE